MTPASKVLVLGGTRFIGLRLVHHLHGLGHVVTVLNRGQTEAALPEGVTRLRADRADPSQVSSALAGKEFDAVFDISGYQPADLEPVIESLDGRVGHYVFCSSVAVYARWDTVPIREDYPSKDASESDGYSAGKVLCEDMLMEAFDRGFPASVVRPPIVYGPHNHIGNREPGIFARLKGGCNIFIAGEGLSLLHPVHVDDLASAFAAIPGRKETLGQAYNAASPDAATENGLVAIIADVVGVDAETVHVERQQHEAILKELDASQASEMFGLFQFGTSHFYSDEKLRRDTGWAPQYNLRDGISMTYRWWLEQGVDREARDFSADDRVMEILRREESG